METVGRSKHTVQHRIPVSLSSKQHILSIDGSLILIFLGFGGSKLSRSPRLLSTGGSPRIISFATETVSVLELDVERPKSAILKVVFDFPTAGFQLQGQMIVN